MTNEHTFTSRSSSTPGPSLRQEEDKTSLATSEAKNGIQKSDQQSLSRSHHGNPQHSGATNLSTYPHVSPPGGAPNKMQRQTTAAGFPAVPKYHYADGRPACMNVEGIARYKAAPSAKPPNASPPPSTPAGPSTSTSSAPVTTTPPPAPPSKTPSRGAPTPSRRLTATDAENREILRLRADGISWPGIARALNQARPAGDSRRVFDPSAVYSAWLIQSAAIARACESEGRLGETRALVEEHLRKSAVAEAAATGTAAKADPGPTATCAPAKTAAMAGAPSGQSKPPPPPPLPPLPPPTIEDVRRKRRVREEREVRASREMAGGNAAGPVSGVAPVAPVHWSREDDEALLGLYREYEERIWGEIAEKMAEMRGRRFSGDQCKQRLMTLKKR
ncbi:MAG: hypothetical protein Q9165_003395 [Trypethelium subeluteriae]